MNRLDARLIFVSLFAHFPIRFYFVARGHDLSDTKYRLYSKHPETSNHLLWCTALLTQEARMKAFGSSRRSLTFHLTHHPSPKLARKLSAFLTYPCSSIIVLISSCTLLISIAYNHLNQLCSFRSGRQGYMPLATAYLFPANRITSSSSVSFA